jgi:signal peptidase II
LIKKYSLFTALALLTITADLVTKELVRHYMTLGASYNIVGSLVKFTFIYNRNAVFGLPCGNQVLYTVFAVVAVIVILYYFTTLTAEQKLEQWALAIIVGGALGNLHDRIRWGQVVDFIEMGYKNYTWPIFNVADMAITIGMVLLIFQMFFKKKATSDSDHQDHRSPVRPGTTA